MTRRLYVSGPMILLIVGLLAGCGGGGSSGVSTRITVTTSSLSKPAYLKRADAICLRGTSDVRPVFLKVLRGVRTPTTEEAAERAFSKMASSVVEQIRGLGAPKGDEAEVRSFLTALQKAIDRGSERPSLPLSRYELLFRDASGKAKRYGLNACDYS